MLFFLNGTSGLSDLYVTEVSEKFYNDETSMPLWGFEETGLALDGISPLWGLLNDSYVNYPNISTFRKPSLYLGGSSDDMFAKSLKSILNPDFQYMPGSDFAPAVMNTVYTMSQGIENSNRGTVRTIDYSGSGNLAVYLRWHKMSTTTDGAARIIDLIWTDLAASAVVGTKGTLGPGNAGKADEVMTMTVQPTVRKIKYHLPFAIPAILLAVVLLLINFAALASFLFGGSNSANLRRRLHQTSTGRIIVASLEPMQDIWGLTSKEWSREYGKMEIDMGTNERLDP